jgi:hypothetical protein
MTVVGVGVAGLGVGVGECTEVLVGAGDGAVAVGGVGPPEPVGLGVGPTEGGRKKLAGRSTSSLIRLHAALAHSSAVEVHGSVPEQESLNSLDGFERSPEESSRSTQ